MLSYSQVRRDSFLHNVGTNRLNLLEPSGNFTYRQV
jgi:hypothetical protein